MSDLEGFDELKKQLEKLGSETRAKLNRAMIAGGNAIMTKARQRAPVDTGYLRRSIITTSNLLGPDVIEVIIGSTAAYAAFVEFGTLPHKGSKGHKEFVEAIKVWAKRKGLPWYLVWRAIVRKGTIEGAKKRGGFLIPAYNQVAPKVYAKLEQIIKEA